MYQLLVNGVADSKSSSQQKHTSAATQNVFMQYFRNFNVNDTIMMQVQNPGTSGKILTTYNKNLMVRRVGS
jgi:hypothetical protein